MQLPDNDRAEPRGSFWMWALFLLVIAGAAVVAWSPWSDEDGNAAPETQAPAQSTPASVTPKLAPDTP